jgi:hypothetical protein
MAGILAAICSLMEAEWPMVTRKREQAIKIKRKEIKKKLLRILHLYVLHRKLALLFVQISEKIIKGSVNLDVDINCDVNWLNFYRFYLYLMSSAGWRGQEASQQKDKKNMFITCCHITYSP